MTNTDLNTTTTIANVVSNEVLNAALVQYAKSNESEMGAGFRFAIALFDYRSALPHSLSDMVHNKTVRKVDKKSGKSGTDLASVASLHKSFLETLPAYTSAVKDAGSVKMDVMTAMDSEKVALHAAKQETAKAFINKTRVAVTRAVTIAYFLDALEVREVSIDKSGKSLTYQHAVKKTDKDGKETTEWKAEHITFTRLLNMADAYIKANNVKPARVTPNVQSADTGTTPKLEGDSAILATASSLVQAIEDTTGEAKEKLATSEPTERLICTALAARFGKRSKMGVLQTMDIGEVFTWLKTQTYFKEVQWTGHAATAEIIRKPTKIIAKK